VPFVELADSWTLASWHGVDPSVDSKKAGFGLAPKWLVDEGPATHYAPTENSPAESHGIDRRAEKGRVQRPFLQILQSVKLAVRQRLGW